MRKLAALFLILACCACAGPQASQAVEKAKLKPVSASPACKHTKGFALKGKLHQLATLQQETTAPQFHYRLDLEEPVCGEKAITFFTPQVLFCTEGKSATLKGELFPPDLIFNRPDFGLERLVSCQEKR